MGSKKKRTNTRPAPGVQERSKGAPWPFIAIAVAVVAGAGIFMASGSSDPAPAADATDPTTQAPSTTPDGSPAGSPGGPDAVASAVTGTPLTVTEPNDLPMPPLPYGAQTAGPPEQVRQAYVFAAQNPGVLEYVPCYCGCGQTDGHISNVDCFVSSRAPNGAVETWDTHGMT